MNLDTKIQVVRKLAIAAANDYNIIVNDIHGIANNGIVTFTITTAILRIPHLKSLAKRLPFI